MTKDQMRSLLALLVPAAEARGDVYTLKRVGSGNAPGKPHDLSYLSNVSPATNPQVQRRAPRPSTYYPRQGVHGAGFEIPTYKTFQQS
jgi:hypothetical protein